MTKFNVVEQIRFCKNSIVKLCRRSDVPKYADNYLNIGADVAVIGEGEETIAELLPAIQQSGVHQLQSINGIVFRDEDGKYIHTPSRPLIQNLDSLPFPDRAAIDVPRYVQTWKTHHGMGSVSLICARGCPYTCTWCSRSVFGETHRRRSAINVVNEIALLIDEYKPDMLWFG